MNTLTLKNSTQSIQLPVLATGEYRTEKGGLVPFKNFVPADYASKSSGEKKALRQAYEAVKKTFWRENKAAAAALMSHDGLIVRSAKIRTSKSGVVSFSISGGEPPKSAGKAIAKQSAAEKENLELKARIAAMEAMILATQTPAAV